MSSKAGDKDGNWSFLQKLGVRPSDGEPEFNECLMKVFRQKTQRKRQDHACKTATHLVKLVTDVAYMLNAEWREYICTSPKGEVITTPLRTLTENSFECMVPLKRPLRLDGFKVFQRGIDEMPQHRCLIQVNPALSKEEAHLVQREWETYIDKNDFLRPKGILDWFNRGLHKVCPVLLTDNHNVDKLGCYVGEDGTASLHTTMSDFDGDELAISVFSVNIYPVFALDSLPSSLKLSAPLPCFGDYIQGQKEFRNLVLKDLEDGKDVAFLDPKSEYVDGPVKKFLPKDGHTWKINLCLTEKHVYSSIEKYCRGLKFRHVMILMNILRDENPNKLGVLNNEILVNTLFNVTQKYIDKIRDKKAWIFKVMQTLAECLEQEFLPSFYHPRQNLLSTYGIPKQKQKTASDTLKTILASVEADPRKLYKFTGYIDPFALPLRQNVAKKPVTQVDGQERPTKGFKAVGEKVALQVREERREREERKESAVSVHSQRVDQDIRKEGIEEKVDNTTNVPLSAVNVNRDLAEEESGISKLSRRGERSDIY